MIKCLCRSRYLIFSCVTEYAAKHEVEQVTEHKVKHEVEQGTEHEVKHEVEQGTEHEVKREVEQVTKQEVQHEVGQVEVKHERTEEQLRQLIADMPKVTDLPVIEHAEVIPQVIELLL